MPDPADAVCWRAPGPGEPPAPCPDAPDVTEAAQWLAVAPEASEDHLDAALMAWLGPGSCVELATIVSRPAGSGEGVAEEGISLAQALELAPTVAAHLAGCAPCSDRQRAMVSVAAVLRRGRPATQVEARLLHPAGGPAGGPPGREPGRQAGRRPLRLSRPAAAAGAAVVVGGLAAGIAYLAWPSSAPSTTPAGSAGAAIGRLPTGGSSLVLDPVATSTAVLHLSDVGQRPVDWQAATTVPWLRVAPATGRLDPGQSVSLALDVVGNQISGLRATVTVNGDDGSVAAASYRP